MKKVNGFSRPPHRNDGSNLERAYCKPAFCPEGVLRNPRHITVILAIVALVVGLVSRTPAKETPPLTLTLSSDKTDYGPDDRPAVTLTLTNSSSTTLSAPATATGTVTVSLLLDGKPVKPIKLQVTPEFSPLSRQLLAAQTILPSASVTFPLPLISLGTLDAFKALQGGGKSQAKKNAYLGRAYPVQAAGTYTLVVKYKADKHVVVDDPAITAFSNKITSNTLTFRRLPGTPSSRYQVIDRTLLQ